MKAPGLKKDQKAAPQKRERDRGKRTKRAGLPNAKRPMVLAGGVVANRPPPNPMDGLFADESEDEAPKEDAAGVNMSSSIVYMLNVEGIVTGLLQRRLAQYVGERAGPAMTPLAHCMLNTSGACGSRSAASTLYLSRTPAPFVSEDCQGSTTVNHVHTSLVSAMPGFLAPPADVSRQIATLSREPLTLSMQPTGDDSIFKVNGDSLLGQIRMSFIKGWLSQGDGYLTARLWGMATIRPLSEKTLTDDSVAGHEDT
ncbi:hypothetical protein KIPB_010434, partial [Kipferlia bialata]|eukprot:g10434.t1